MKQTRLGGLGGGIDGRFDSTQVGQGRGVGQTVEELRDTGVGGGSLLAIAPVASSKGIADTVCDQFELDMRESK